MLPRCEEVPTCVRALGHDGSHLTEREGLMIRRGYDMAGQAIPRYEWTDYLNEWDDERLGRNKIPDPTNKPAYKRLLRKGAP